MSNQTDVARSRAESSVANSRGRGAEPPRTVIGADGQLYLLARQCPPPCRDRRPAGSRAAPARAVRTALLRGRPRMLPLPSGAQHLLKPDTLGGRHLGVQREIRISVYTLTI